uniref:PNPLA domain-containing protein n=1 Tax=viral metagenome TaxID=1070528 RepID=A0A6C0KQ80_9ZZZZ
MKEISFNIFVLSYIYFIKNFFTSKSIEKIYLKLDENDDYKKQIFFECGGGYWSYYCGIMKFIKEKYSNNILNKIVWLGTSAGIYPVINAMKHFNPNKSMSVMKDGLNEVPQTWYGLIYRSNNLIKKYCHDNYLNNYENEIISYKNNLFIGILNLNIICPIFSSVTFYYNFDNINEFTESCLISHGIPFITGPLKNTFVKHPKKWYIIRTDAGILTLLFGLIFGYELFMPYGKQVPSYVISVNSFRKLNFSWLWIWPNLDHHEKMYKLGYEDAKANETKIDQIIL